MDRYYKHDNQGWWVNSNGRTSRYSSINQLVKSNIAINGQEMTNHVNWHTWIDSSVWSERTFTFDPKNWFISKKKRKQLTSNDYGVPFIAQDNIVFLFLAVGH